MPTDILERPCYPLAVMHREEIWWGMDGEQLVHDSLAGAPILWQPGRGNAGLGALGAFWHFGQLVILLQAGLLMVFKPQRLPSGDLARVTALHGKMSFSP